MGWVCPKCGYENEADELFCGECGTKLGESISPMQSPIPKLEDMHSQLKSLIPEALAQKYLSAEQQSGGQNRPITALFADISGFTPLSATMSSESIFHKVQDCFKQLVSIVADYEGSIGGFQGDGLLALFGAPIMHENDAERAILSAIKMRQAMKDQRLQVSIGINTAMMTVGEIQTQLHSEYTAYGTDVNLAKRLQESAEPDQILVGTGTYRLTRRAFDFDVIPSIKLKGFTEQVKAYSVQQAKSRPEKLRGIEGLRARMIGREHEFAEVQDSVNEWLDGHGQIISIIGEAGIGKSRLVTELRKYIAEKHTPNPSQEGSLANSPLTKGDKGGCENLIFEGRCLSIGQPISYLPFIDILRTYFNLSEGDDMPAIAQKVTDQTKQLFPNSADETLPFLGNLLSIKFGNDLDSKLKFATPEQIRHQTLMQLKDMFAEMARKQPLMMILEDLHWADELSLDLVSHLMDELSHIPLMLVCVYRPEKESRVMKLGDQAQRKCFDKYTEITLKPLSRLQSRQLVEDLLTIDDLPESVRDTILQKSEGNPFFIEEIIRSLIEQGMVYQEADRWKAKAEINQINVPDTIQSVVLSRVDRLKEEARYVLQCASVIGRLFRYRLLDHITAYEQELDSYLSEFEERDLVYEERAVPELEYAFKHAFTQEATYQGILERGRRAFHSQVALGIERLYQERLEDYYGELAHHYSRSDDPEKAIEYLLKAGEKAKRNYANDTAISYYQRVLDTLEKHNITRDDWKLEALRGLGEIYLGVGKIDDALKMFEEAIKLAKDMGISPRQITRLYFWIADTLYWQSKYDEIMLYGEEGLKLLGDDTKCVEAVLMKGAFFVGNSGLGNVKKQVECVHEYMPFIKDLPYCAELRPAYCHIIEVLAWSDNDFDEAWKWSEDLLAILENHNDIRAIAEIIIRQSRILAGKGDYQGRLLLTTKCLNLSKQIGDNKHYGRDLGNFADILFSLGEVNEANKVCHQALNMSEQIGSPIEIAIIYQLLARISICQSHFDEAISCCQRGYELFQKTNNPNHIIRAKFRLGYAYMKKEDYDQAIKIFYEFADKVFEFQDENAQLRLFQTLESFECVYRSLDKRSEFLDFCKSYREKHAESVKELPLQQWYLEPAPISDKYSNRSFTDDFDNEPLDSSWSWLNPLEDCSYRIVATDKGQKGLEISAVNGRDLFGQNLSAPRFIREVTGDFAVQVCILSPSEDKPQLGGLLIWKDESNYLCFCKGGSDRYGFQFYGYLDKKQLIAGRGYLPDKNDENVYLRLERSGDIFSAYVSADGTNWLTCGKLAMSLDDPIQVGIYAHGMINRTVYCGEYREGSATTFREFRIWK
jgi:class 3 adenylate cyclase/tetratricopeptide (TPR) repeat protein/regulation of enolase protein 1 (concanavalin A-like superfamily)